METQASNSSLTVGVSNILSTFLVHVIEEKILDD